MGHLALAGESRMMHGSASASASAGFASFGSESRPHTPAASGWAAHKAHRGPCVLDSEYTALSAMAEIVSAAEKREWVKVEVRRRPLEAVPSSECGSLQAVGLGLGQLTLAAFRRTPDSGLLCRAQPQAPLSHFFHFACRRSSLPVTTSTAVARALSCHVAESQNFSPPLSLAIAVFLDYFRFGTLC
jgi:hypothetical protein